MKLTNEIKQHKLTASKKLISDYTDSFGRVTLYHNSKSDPQNGIYDSENQHLWTGEALILLYLTSQLNGEHIQNFYSSLKSTKIQNKAGLYARHPAPYINIEHHNVSWDEYEGIMFGLAVTEQKHKANVIINYGEKNAWIFLDSPDELLAIDKPTNKFTKWFYSTKYGKYIYKFIYLRLSAWRQPKERAFYRIVSGQKPSVFEVFHMALALISTSRRPPGDTSGKLLAWFKIQAIRISGFKSKIWDWAVKKFDKNLKAQYNNEYYIENLIEIYFKDPEHPFHELAKGILLCNYQKTKS